MSEGFKVGDKVSHPMWGNGEVNEVDDFYSYPVQVTFKNGSLHRFSKEGKWTYNDIATSLYHGHGTFEIVFRPEPEPVYEWQWLVKRPNGEFFVSGYRGCPESYAGTVNSHGELWHSRIEESKREVKP
jgi:hypothetical protein